MFNNNIQRNFEWLEASFTRKIQHIIDESNRDNASWVRDLFISILLTILPLACELISNHRSNNSEAEASTMPDIVQTICMYGTVISLIGLVIWIGFCIWKYNKIVQKFKSRIIPHTINGKYSIEESVHYFDNDVCNDLILSKHYIALALNESDSAGKEFYLIEALHYYYKSIRRFNIICKSHDPSALNKLFTSNRAGTDKCIDLVRLINYLALIKSIKIPVNTKDDLLTEDDLLIYKRVLDYNNSFRLIVSTFDSTYATLQDQLSPIADFAQKNEKLIGITQNITSRISTCSS